MLVHTWAQVCFSSAEEGFLQKVMPACQHACPPACLRAHAQCAPIHMHTAHPCLHAQVTWEQFIGYPFRKACIIGNLGKDIQVSVPEFIYSTVLNCVVTLGDDGGGSG